MRWFKFPAIGVVFFFAFTCGVTGKLPPPATRAMWDEIDIIPMPKHISLSGKFVPLTDTFIVLGAKTTEQDRIGADWINRRVRELGGASLVVCSQGEVPKTARITIHVGTRSSSTTVGRLADAAELDVGPKRPGRNGYVIHAAVADGRGFILLAGADPVGALYACVTFAGLLSSTGEGIAFREAEVADWPDFLAVTEDISMYHPERGNLSSAIRWGTPPAKTLVAFVEAMKEHLDRLLAWKISCFEAFEIQRWRQLSPEAMDAYKQVTDYAKARGIRSLSYAFKPFAGRIGEFPDAPKRCATLHNGTRWRGLLRCWSLDEERRQTAKRLAEVIRRTGITDAGFHDTDTGGFLSPAQWEERCDVCRKRWGDDFAAATVHKHMIYYNAIKTVAPECRLHFTIYPYNISVLTQEGAEKYHVTRYGPSPSIPAIAEKVRDRLTAFWRKIAPAIPEDATFCIRENTIDNVRRFHELTAPHGVFTWYKSGSEQWQTFYDETPRWLPTFYSGPNDLVFTVTLQTFLPVKSLAVREYTWNTKTPGAALWGRQGGEAFSQHAEGGNEAYTIVLPHLVRGIFGRQIAEEITIALSTSVAYNQIFDDRHRMTPVLTTYKKMQDQVDQAAEAAGALDRAFVRLIASPDLLGMDAMARRWFVYTREVYHCCMWMARTRAFDLLAREKARAGDLAAAKQAIADGRQAVADAQQAMERLVAERPEDPIYNAKPTGNNYKRRWRRYTPTWGTDFEPRREALDQTERELPELAAGDLSPRMVQELGRRRSVHLGRTDSRITVDGVLGEPAWAEAQPIEAFLVYPKQDRMARADTRVQLLASETHLYAAYTCWMPANAPIRAQSRARDASLADDELVELFLAPPGLKGGYYQFLVNAAGSVSDKRVILVKDASGLTVSKRDTSWDGEGLEVATRRQADRWTLELGVPFASLGETRGKGRWRVNLCRDHKAPAGARELSTIMVPGARDFHDRGKFLYLVSDRTRDVAPHVQINVGEVRTSVQTMDDRVATVVSLDLGIESTRILHGAGLTLEAYDATGKLHAREAVLTVPHVRFRWEHSKSVEIGFERQGAEGGIRVLLVSEETEAEHWVRLGGWAGRRDLASLFAPAEKADVDGFGASPSLREACVLPPDVAVPGSDERSRILCRAQGTFEFWFKPLWPPLPHYDERPAWRPVYTLLHAGVLRRDHPYLANHSAFTIDLEPHGHAIRVQVRNRDYAGWDAYGRITDSPSFWQEQRWHHLACVWEQSAAPEEMLRLYVDGRRVSGPCRLSKPDRLVGREAIDLGKSVFALQLLAMNTGRRTAPVLLDELRISRSVRYRSDFTPNSQPFVLDEQTTALFHFDGSLAGQGTVPGHGEVPLTGVPGALELH